MDYRLPVKHTMEAQEDEYPVKCRSKRYLLILLAWVRARTDPLCDYVACPN